jgi:hypothetical protein
VSTGTETGGQVVAGFEYGPTISYGHETEGELLESGPSTSSIHQGITGLEPNSTYHYRIVVVGEGTIIHGADRTFTTTALLPIGIDAGEFDFAASHYPAMLLGEQDADHPLKFTVNSRLVSCSSATLSGELPSSSSAIALASTYFGCVGAGLPAAISMNGCNYGFHALAGSEPTAGSLAVICAEPSEAIEISINEGTCLLRIPPQESLNSITLADYGEGAERGVNIGFGVSGLKMSVIGGLLACGTNGSREGILTGHVLLTGREP